MSFKKPNENDWQLLQQKIPAWQEASIEQLLQKYIAILQEDTKPSERLQKLEGHMKLDSYRTGVSVDMRRSRYYLILIDLLKEGVITMEDLDDFSDETKDVFRPIFDKPEA